MTRSTEPTVETRSWADRAWLQTQRRWEAIGLNPGAYTAFITGYLAALEDMREYIKEQEQNHEHRVSKKV